jgi:lysophospholipase L1-like esterase
MIPQTESSAVQVERQVGPRRLVIFRITTILIGLFAGLLVAELGLRMVEKVRLGDRAAPATIPDPLLRYRLVPNTPGHDANGFRNASVRSQVDIVTLGDSQTWGVNVQSVDAWPQQLERLSGRPVYNMAVGGYGPVQYWMLTEKAVGFAPKVIIVGLYFGNDIYDAYALAYSNDNYAELRSNQACDEMNIDTVKTRSQFYWDEEKNFHNNYGRSSPTGWSFWLREHSAIGRLLNRAGLWPGATDVDYEIDKAWARAYPDHGAVCEDADIRTVFTTAYHLTGLDFDDPRVGEGLRITKEVLWRAHQKADKSGVKLLVLLIPTKELVYADLMQREGKLNGTYARLVEMENQSRHDVESWCNEKRIRCVDALPNLQRAIAGRQQIYPSTTESHPNAAGYRVLAATVNEALKN